MLRVFWRLSTDLAAQSLHALASGAGLAVSEIRARSFVMTLPFTETAVVRWLNVLRQLNVHLLQRELRALQDRQISQLRPLLYESGVRYEPELHGEIWSDVASVYAVGFEDCDALAPARAAELEVFGAAALWPHMPGWQRARELGLTRIPSEVQLQTPADTPVNGPGLYHAVVRYQVDGVTYIDDPSMRLGMHGELDFAVRVAAAWGPVRSHNVLPQARYQRALALRSS
jgi:hypothetical protein